MRIVPCRIRPYGEPINRKHTPEDQSTHRKFRECLDWDFGFTCPFCLVHERQLEPLGLEGAGLIWIEHIERQENLEEGDDEKYENVIYCCQFCNRKRGRKDLEELKERDVLDPTEDNWAAHFSIEDFELEPQSPRAEETVEVYGINDDTRVTLRRKLYKEVTRRFESAMSLEKYRSMFQRFEDPLSDKEERLKQAAAEYLKRSHEARRELIERYTIIPPGANRNCKCDEAEGLPRHVAEQTWKVDLHSGDFDQIEDFCEGEFVEYSEAY